MAKKRTVGHREDRFCRCAECRIGRGERREPAIRVPVLRRLEGEIEELRRVVEGIMNRQGNAGGRVGAEREYLEPFDDIG